MVEKITQNKIVQSEKLIIFSSQAFVLLYLSRYLHKWKYTINKVWTFFPFIMHLLTDSQRVKHQQYKLASLFLMATWYHIKRSYYNLLQYVVSLFLIFSFSNNIAVDSLHINFRYVVVFLQDKYAEMQLWDKNKGTFKFFTIIIWLSKFVNIFHSQKNGMKPFMFFHPHYTVHIIFYLHQYDRLKSGISLFFN